ncbi:MAG: cell division protein FtsL [Clostridiales bacterium]|nr:cell division protein FtsL [Clostridiales bacterium]
MVVADRRNGYEEKAGYSRYAGQALPKRLPDARPLRQPRVLTKTKPKPLHQLRVILLGLVIILFCSAMVYMAMEAKISSLAWQINQIKKGMNDLDADRERLKLEVENLSSVERVEAYASEHLDMMYPEAEDVMYLDFNAFDLLFEEASEPLFDFTAKEIETGWQAGLRVKNWTELKENFWQSLYKFFGQYFFNKTIYD